MTHDHSHHGSEGASERRLLVTLCILSTFTAIEALGGWLANSLALFAEASHMLADSGSLLLALVAIRASRRPADAQHTYGSSRYQTLAAYTNGLLLLALTVWVMVEAVRRLFAPPAVDGALMLAVALLGGAANLSAFMTLSGARSLNERGARAHILGDLLGSVAAVGAALLILELGWRLADPLLSILVSLLILRSGWHLTREAGHVLLQGAPPALDPDRLVRDRTGIGSVRCAPPARLVADWGSARGHLACNHRRRRRPPGGPGGHHAAPARAPCDHPCDGSARGRRLPGRYRSPLSRRMSCRGATARRTVSTH
jgi:cobalt-zinc-cadmium efflux system protein